MIESEPEPPHISSTLQWKDVSLPAQLTTVELDALIFSELRIDSLKTMRIVARVVDALEKRSISIDDQIVGARIRELADTKKIRSFGNVSMWRHSEVCLP